MVTTPSASDEVVDPVMLLSMLCTCEIRDVMAVVMTLILIWAADSTLIWVVLNEMEMVFVCDIRDDRYLKNTLTLTTYRIVRCCRLTLLWCQCRYHPRHWRGSRS